jgi:hypothetical protein
MTASDSIPTKKVVSIRQDLLSRLQAYSKELKQNANQFANLCVEGCMDAIELEGAYEIPIVQLARALKGKSCLTSKSVMAICAAFVPEVYEVDSQQRKFLIELINKHDGPLTSGILKGYFGLSEQMNAQRIDHEKQITKLSLLGTVQLGAVKSQGA